VAQEPQSNPKLFAQSTALWRRVSPGKRLFVVATLAATIFGVGYLTCTASDVDYVPLFSSLSADDAADVTSRLRGMDVPYRLDGGGTMVAVPKDKVHEVRIALSSEGLPRGGGIGFEVFDEQSFGTTSFVEQINYRRALQGELARTVSAVAAVESARVHIAIGERSLYQESDDPPSASVALKLRAGQQLTSAQVRGIVHLVASSVQGLTPERVVIIDDRGNVLSAGDEDVVQVEAQRELEQTLALRIREMIERFVGRGGVAVVVTAEMDQLKVDSTEERFDKDNVAVRSEAITQEGAAGAVTVGGIAGARGNLPGASPPTAGPSGAGLTSLSETRNYEVNRIVTRTIGPTAKLKRLHVAVLVDNVKNPEDPTASTPRAPEDLKRIEGIAREAAGLDSDRGDKLEVHNVAFAVEPELGETAAASTGGFPLDKKTLILIGAALSALMALGVVVMLARRPVERRQLMALPATLTEVERQLGAREGGESKQLEGPSIYDRVVAAARADVGQATRVIQGWLAEGRSST
jgi:flagellar M-ring protein FliF